MKVWFFCGNFGQERYGRRTELLCFERGNVPASVNGLEEDGVEQRILLKIVVKPIDFAFNSLNLLAVNLSRKAFILHQPTLLFTRTDGFNKLIRSDSNYFNLLLRLNTMIFPLYAFI